MTDLATLPASPWVANQLGPSASPVALPCWKDLDMRSAPEQLFDRELDTEPLDNVPSDGTIYSGRVRHFYNSVDSETQGILQSHVRRLEGRTLVHSKAYLWGADLDDVVRKVIYHVSIEGIERPCHHRFSTNASVSGPNAFQKMRLGFRDIHQLQAELCQRHASALDDIIQAPLSTAACKICMTDSATRWARTKSPRDEHDVRYVLALFVWHDLRAPVAKRLNSQKYIPPVGMTRKAWYTSIGHGDTTMAYTLATCMFGPPIQRETVLFSHEALMRRLDQYRMKLRDAENRIEQLERDLDVARGPNRYGASLGSSNKSRNEDTDAGARHFRGRLPITDTGTGTDVDRHSKTSPRSASLDSKHASNQAHVFGVPAQLDKSRPHSDDSEHITLPATRVESRRNANPTSRTSRRYMVRSYTCIISSTCFA
ncbi:hypothetical protein BDZ85DRAFT_255818 [Elsinoe ampelina]|uniref:Uncharacterized protein n=1 Tax=Elsinoe ampelina TaxID=302913 RepID=A0A6A6GKP2_9PEZI|nr:hypothetical protein BDZ85DRAFT_255818 [Elsinoe ampelina]